MKRLIKFRGFNKKNGKWLNGSYILNRGHHFVAPDEFAEGKTWDDYEVEEDTIGQFVDMTDSEGTMIYEGDIVTYAVSYAEGKIKVAGVVFWDFDNLTWMIGTGVGDFALSNSDYRNELKVIGNNYEGERV